MATDQPAEHAAALKEEAAAPADIAALDVVHALLVTVLADRDEGRVRTVAEYQSLFPGHDALIERELVTLAGLEPPGAQRTELAARARAGEYELVRRLGAGGQSTVWEGRNPATGERAAIKFLLPLDAIDARARLRIERERTALAALAHPGMVRVLGSGDSQGVPFLALELVEGEDLAARISRARAGEPWPPNERLDVIVEVARAVHAAHQLGVLHRDLKPSNVVLRRDGHAVLVDFGLAKLVRLTGQTLTRTGELIGTPPYLPPEVLAPTGDFDRQSDVYMLGALLFECCALRPPFAAASRTLLFEQIVAREAPDLRTLEPSVPRAVAAIAAAALAKDPAQRYSSAAAFADDLERARAGSPIALRRAGPLARLAAWRRRKPLLVGSLGVLCAISALGATIATATSVRAWSLLRASEVKEARLRAVALGELAARDLWPVLPELRAALHGWLAEAEAVREELERARDSTRGQTSEPARRGTAEALSRDLAALDAARADVERRVGSVDEVERWAGLSEAAWREAAKEVVGDPRYGGLHLESEIGLVPLGRDPESGWLEFAHPQSGTPPRRDPRTGKLCVDSESSLVFVLLPAGTFLMGAEPPSLWRSATQPNIDPSATDTGEWPIHVAWVEPFFLSKYELTQGQWLRLAGTNPSRWKPGSDAFDPITLAHPVENVNWRMADELLRRFGLALPDEAQWEYAARAGTTTPWSTGRERASLAGVANIADRSSLRAGLEWAELARWPEYDDGHVEHAPVGSFAPNAWGFHEMHGNVWELCADTWGFYWEQARIDRATPDPLAPRVKRGGGIYESWWHCRSSSRQAVAVDERTFSLGVRPARALGSARGAPSR